MTWIVYDPYIDPVECDSEDEALTYAQDLTSEYLDGEGWVEGVENIRIAKITHVTKCETTHTRAEMTEEEWDALTGGVECDELVTYKPTPIDPEPAELTLKRVRLERDLWRQLAKAHAGIIRAYQTGGRTPEKHLDSASDARQGLADLGIQA